VALLLAHVYPTSCLLNNAQEVYKVLMLSDELGFVGLVERCLAMLNQAEGSSSNDIKFQWVAG